MNRVIRLTSVDARLTVDGEKAVVVHVLQLGEDEVGFRGQLGVVPWKAKYRSAFMKRFWYFSVFFLRRPVSGKKKNTYALTFPFK